MIQTGISLGSGSVFLFPTTCKSKAYFPAIKSRQQPASVSYHGIRNSWRPCKQLNLQSSNGTHLLPLGAGSTPFLSGDDKLLSHSVPTMVRQQQRPLLAPRASIYFPDSIRYPRMTEKAKWWWRTLACLPYLISLRDTWKFAETAYLLYPFLEKFEFLTHGFYKVFDRLPWWITMAYYTTAYLGAVRNKKLPHFFRFHFVMAMLLETGLQIIETVSGWFPFAFYGGRIGYSHFWVALGVAYFFTVMVCMRAALVGMYANIPVVSDSAYIHSHT